MASTTSELPSSMKACRWTSNAGGIEANLKLDQDVPLPKGADSLPAGSTLVKVAYTSLNPFDYKVAEAPILGQYVLPKPAIPCLDFSGTVVRTTLPHLEAGDRVHGRTNPPAFGCLAEYVVVGKDGISKVPDGLPLRKAATAGIAALAAYQCIKPYVKAGDHVFINGGSGGTGTFGIQIAKQLGCRVTTTCSAANMHLCQGLGAEEVINYKTVNVLERLKGREQPFSLVVDNVWEDGTLFWHSQGYLEPSGTFVTPGGTKPVQLRDLALGNLLPSWLGGGQANFVFWRCKPVPEDMAQLTEWMAAGKIKAVIEQEYEMADASKAFEKLKTGRVKGKLVVRISSQERRVSL